MLITVSLAQFIIIDVNNKIEIYKFQVLACVSAASFHFPIGIIIGFSAIMIPQLQAPDSEIPLDKEGASWIGNYCF